MLIRRVLLLVVVSTAVLAPLRSVNAQISVEAQVMSLINGGRSSPLELHSGLLQAARGHSHEMALRGGLDHDGADERVNNAPPDPYETNGAPDDGFGVAAWCENVTYSMATAESDAGSKIYSQWKNSSPHRQCMENPGKNVGAVGVYYDGQTWWATFIAEVDSSPPGGTVATKSPGAGTADHPSATPVHTTVPVALPVANADDPTPSPVGLVEPVVAGTHRAIATPTSDSATTIVVEPLPTPVHGSSGVPSFVPPVTRKAPFHAPLGYGWQELLGVAGVLAIATLRLRRVVLSTVGGAPRPPEIERLEYVPAPPERELVGAGAPNR